MASFISTALFLLLDVTSSIHPAVSQSINLTEPMCYDWGESNKGVVSILEGEAGWLSCPLFSHPSVYNYNSTQNAGHNLFWYHIPEGQDLEQPISYSSRLSKDRERLWLQPAAAEDTGQYICMLRNKSSCSKISMRLKVLRPDQVTRPVDCAPPVPMEATKAVIPLQEGDTLHCPDLQDAMKTSNVPPNVTWQHVGPGNSRCYKVPFWNTDREQQGTSLEVHVMLVHYQGLYFCRVDFQRSGRALSFTRSINVTAIQPSSQPKEPTILHPHEHQVFTVKRDTDAHLVCRALFPVIRENSSWEMWWTVDGKMLNELANSQRFKQNSSVVNDNFGDKTVDSILVIRNIQAEDLKREINCSVRNPKGFDSRRAQLEEDVSLPSVELGCGLGVTLVLMLLLFVVYHVFWLELLLLYRSWFGTDERHTDDKEYDVYISYARNSEEEQFVLSTLRSVLENELGYSVCIFDRDSLPGGNVSDGVLRSMQRSRRLLFVLSPDFLAEKSFSLLECRLGLYLQHGLQASIVAVVYRSIRKLACAEAVQLRQSSVSTVMWRGGRSEPRRSRFWLRLQLALPVRPLALGRRLIDSTSSHSDLAALALQRVQRLQNQNHEGRTSRSQRNRRTSVNQNRRDRKALPRGRGSVRSSVSCRGVGPQHSRSCSRCAGLVGQLEDRWAELTVEVEPQRGSYDRTEAQSYHSVPETDTAPIPPDSAHDDSNAPNHGPSADSALPSGQPDDAGMQIQQQQQIIGSRTSEETSEEKGEELDVKKTVTPPPTKTTAVPLTDELKQQV